jgi:phosphatidylinositol 4-kinase
VATGPNSGLIELITDSTSLDHLKRHPAYTSLRAHFEAAYGGVDSAAFGAAQHAFTCSLAAYSMVSYVLGIKDRHNGNLLLDRQGRLTHIDFGFVLGKAPGGVASLEASVPFKLTREMVDVMGGPTAPLFTQTFVELCTAALQAIRARAQEILGLAEITAEGMPCFQGAGAAPLAGLRARMLLDVPDRELRPRVAALVAASHGNMNTYLYDRFQRMSNGISE